jgi:hypothetical protein
LPANDLLHSHIVNGAFTHGSSESRFSSPSAGAWYASEYLDPVDLSAAQLLAENLRAEGSLGIRYPSGRDPSGMNIVLFQPTVVQPVMKGQHYEATWTKLDDPAAWRVLSV